MTHIDKHLLCLSTKPAAGTLEKTRDSIQLLEIIIKIAEDNDAQRWDNYVIDHPKAGPYHLYGWKTAVEQAYGHKGYYLLAEDGSGSILGVLPLICFRMPWGRKTLISLPYCDYGGPLGDPSVQNLLVNECKKLAQKLGASEIELRCPSKNQIVGSHKPFPQVLSHKVRMLLTLPDCPENLWKGFKSKLRSQIRKPIKEGLICKIGNSELVADFYQVFSINMRDLGSPVHSKRLFDALCSNYREKAVVGVVYKEDIPVAAGLILLFGSTASIPWASSLRAYNRLAPNMLLYWTFLSWAADNGFQEFDFGRSTPGEGTYRFKKQWGAEPKPLYWYYVGNHGAEPIDAANKNNIKRKIAALWSKMPRQVVNVLGPVIRRYISL